MRESTAPCVNETVRIAGHSVTITPRRSSKRLTLRPDAKRNGFALSVPVGLPRQKALDFLAGQQAWMDRTAAARLMDWTPAYAPGERHSFLGRTVTLGADGVPAGRGFIVMRQRALEALIRQLLPVWEERMGLRAACVRFRNMRSRWGSCQSQKREIHLSTLLAEVPPACVEYVLVHELCHFRHPDHSVAFHAEMTRYMPDWKARRETLARLDRRPMPPETK